MILLWLWDRGGFLPNLQAMVLVLVDCCGLVVKWQCTLIGAISTCAELVFQIHVQLATFLGNTKYWHGLPLTKYGAFHISFDIIQKHVPWDPSGSLQQRLRDKPCFMEGGMSGTLNIAFNWAGQWTGEELDWAYVGQWTEEELDWVCIGPRRHQMRCTRAAAAAAMGDSSKDKTGGKLCSRRVFGLDLPFLPPDYFTL